MRTPGLRFVLWGATAVLVTGAATVAIAASVGASGSNPLSKDDVARALAVEHSTPMATDPPATAAASAAAGGGHSEQVFSAAAGQVTVRCDGDMATLVSWSPYPGYRAGNPVRGPAAQVSVTFESASDEAKLVVTCSNGVGSLHNLTESDDHGWGDDDGTGATGSGG